MKNLEQRLTPKMETLLTTYAESYEATVLGIREKLRAQNYWTNLPYWVVMQIWLVDGVGMDSCPSDWFTE